MSTRLRTDLRTFRKRFQVHLERYTLTKLENASVHTRDANKLMRIVTKLILAPGKRMRPYLLHRTARTYNISSKVTIPVGVAIELFHDFALVHDDIMDRSDERRGKHTVHKIYELEHARKDWKGSPEHYGLSNAILAGDLILNWSESSFMNVTLEKPVRSKLNAAWETLKEEVILGQTLDVVMSVLPHGISRKQLMNVLALKSGRYSIGRPMLMGYALANVSVPERVVLNATEPLGLAFQIQDDIISTFGNPRETGKSIDADLREGKMTLLAWETVRRIPTTKAKIIWNRVFGKPNATKHELDELRKLIRDTGALAYVKTLAGQLINQAEKRAHNLPKCAAWFTELANELRDRRT